MVRKQTWILLIIFALLLGGTFYLQKNPLPNNEALTPSPTTSPKLLEGWEGSDIVWMELKENQASPIQIVQDQQGNWSLESGAAADAGKVVVETGKAEQLRTEIAEMRATATLPASYQLEAIGLNALTRSLSIRDAQGKQITINIGKTDPTNSGYYVQVGTQAPVVVNKYTLEGIIDLFNGVLPTPGQETPTVTPSP